MPARTLSTSQERYWIARSSWRTAVIRCSGSANAVFAGFRPDTFDRVQLRGVGGPRVDGQSVVRGDALLHPSVSTFGQVFLIQPVIATSSRSMARRAGT